MVYSLTVRIKDVLVDDAKQHTSVEKFPVVARGLLMLIIKTPSGRFRNVADQAHDDVEPPGMFVGSGFATFPH